MKKTVTLFMLLLLAALLVVSCDNKTEVPAAKIDEILDFKDYAGVGWQVSLKDDVRSTITSVDIPASYEGKDVLTVGGFENAVNLESVTFPDTVYYIEEFKGCTKLKSVEIPKSVVVLSGCTFEDCTSLESVTFESGSKLQYIDRPNCFAKTNISSITLPEGLEGIGMGTFYNCKNLKTIYIPNSMYEIGSDICQGINENAVITIDRVENSIYTGSYHSWGTPATVKFNWTGKKTTYTVTYNPNGADEGEEFPTEVKEYGTKITVSDCPSGWKKDGYTFKGWNTDSRGVERSFSAGDTYTGPTVTFYAMWEKNN